MKLLLTLVLVLFCTLDTLAECAWSGMWAYPRGGELEQNSGILIIGYGDDQKLIDLLGKEHEVFLRSKEHQVRLLPRERHQGMMQLRQVFLLPEEQLIAGGIYELIVEGLDGSRLRRTYDIDLDKMVPYSYKIREGRDESIPAWLELPELKDRVHIQYGCGPEKAAVFGFGVDAVQGLLFKTEFRKAGSRSVHSYLLWIEDEDGMLRVGHDMCSGAFTYEDRAGEYEVRFSLLDLAGNTDGSWTEWIRFKGP